VYVTGGRKPHGKTGDQEKMIEGKKGLKNSGWVKKKKALGESYWGGKKTQAGARKGTVGRELQ